MVLCLLMIESKKECVKKKVRFTEYVKQLLEAHMMCTINGDMFYSFTKNTWIRDLGASCHITNNQKSIFDITDINELIQGRSSIIPAMNKGKLYVIVQQVDGTEWVQILWPMMFCPKADVNLFSLTCKLSQEKKISSDHWNNIVVSSTSGILFLIAKSRHVTVELL